MHMVFNIYKWIYSFVLLGVFDVSCNVVGLYLYLQLGSIILLGDRLRLYQGSWFPRMGHILLLPLYNTRNIDYMQGCNWYSGSLVNYGLIVFVQV